jgi:phosphoribosylformimino-5-aminoimidazole carboxamide ribotide isomerase
LLDLARVGSGRGIDRSLIVKAQAEFPDLTILAGGGITGPEELSELHSLGISGALIATALHNGAIGPQHIRSLT